MKTVVNNHQVQILENFLGSDTDPLTVNFPVETPQIEKITF